FLSHATATTEIYTLSLHDALPISRFGVSWISLNRSVRHCGGTSLSNTSASEAQNTRGRGPPSAARFHARGLRQFAGDVFERACRSEEHTSELQSRENLVSRLLLEK